MHVCMIICQLHQVHHVQYQLVFEYSNTQLSTKAVKNLTCTALTTN